MEIQLTGGPIPHDIQYFLDCSVECMDMPPDVYLWAKHFNPNTAEIIDNFDNQPELRADEHWETLQNYGFYLERLYLEWQQTADPIAVALCLTYGMHYMPPADHCLREAVGTLVDTERNLLSGIKFYDSAVAYKGDGMVRYNGLIMFERKRPFFESLKRIRIQYESIEKPNWSELVVVQPEWVARHREYINNYRGKKPLKPQTKKALRRSSELLDTLTGERTTKLFLSGEKVEVTGQRYKFVLTKDPNSSLSTSHGAARTRVYDRQTDEFVCGLCVYTANVTVFDHLASIVLHCKSGLEDQIIMDANITERGNIQLLPKAKLDQLEKPREQNAEGPWHDYLMDTIDTAEFGIMRQIRSLEDPAVRAHRARVDAANAIAQKKFNRRVKKLYPDLLGYSRVEQAALPQLFYGPEIA